MIALAAVMLALVVLPPPPPGTGCKVPRVVGKQLTVAKRILATHGCNVRRVIRHYSPEPRGEVLKQSPRPGAYTVGPRSWVALWISRGSRPS